MTGVASRGGGPANVVIWGAGDTGGLVAYILGYDPAVRVVAMLDDDAGKRGGHREGLPVLRPDNEGFAALKRDGVTGGIVAIGNGRLRERCSAVLERHGLNIVNAVHPTAFLSPRVTLGKGVIIGARSTLFFNPRIGNYVFIGPGVTISHDTVIEDGVELAAGCLVVSRVRIGRHAFIGAGAHLMSRTTERLAIGEGATVGVGAAVIDDVPANAVAVGVPARVVRYREVDEAPGAGRGAGGRDAAVEGRP